MEVEEPRRLERVGAAADVFIRANDASVSSRSCGAIIMVAVYYFYEVLLQYYDVIEAQ